jgi:hypothetical protein
MSGHEKTALILIIDNEESICEECRYKLSRLGLEVFSKVGV